MSTNYTCTYMRTNMFMYAYDTCTVCINTHTLRLTRKQFTVNNSFSDYPQERISELLHSMQSCISDVKAWATANMLKLNDSKIELMHVTSKRSKHLHNLPTSITIGNAQTVCEKFGFYIGLSSYYECTCLQYCLDMLL